MWENINGIIKPQSPVLLFGNEPFSSYLRISNVKGYKYDLIWKKSKCGSPLTAKYAPLSKHENISVFSLKGGKTNYYPIMESGKPYKRKFTETKLNNMGFGINGAGADNNGTRHPSRILDFPQKWRRQDQVHPTQKPVELLEYLIKTYTKEGDIVIDFTAGSFSTAVACVKTNRRFIGIECETKYFDIGIERVKEILKK